MADAVSQQGDLNKDQQFDLDDFQNSVGQNGGSPKPGNWRAPSPGEAQYTPNSYQPRTTSRNGTPIQNLYEQSSYPPTSDAGPNGINAIVPSTLGVNGSQQVDPRNPRNLFIDPNPQIIRRPAQGGVQTYTQNVRIRFLQPPPPPPPGPLIIKEVRPPQPPPPPPLRIRQQAPSLPQPPPLVLRERPPNPPALVGPQTVIRRLPALPVPPRSVVIERLPPLPPKPRDIIIERWIPYGAQEKRKTIVQRAAGGKGYPKPRNIIIIYEPIQVRVVRQFQRLGITQENPQVYTQRYGATLLDPQTLVQQARAAGVIEDIAPPINTTANTGFTDATYGIERSSSNAQASPSPFEPASLSSNQQTSAGLSGLESAEGTGSFGNDSFPTSYESNPVAAQDDPGTALNGTNTSGYDSQNTFEDGLNNTAADPVNAAFSAADLNNDGRLDADEFRQFLKLQFRDQQ